MRIEFSTTARACFPHAFLAPYYSHIVINRCQESLRLLNHYGVKRDEEEEELP